MKTLFNFIKVASSTLKLKPYRSDLRTLNLVKKSKNKVLGTKSGKENLLCK